MPRKMWTGSINFGLVTIPVGLYSATEDRSIQFHQYERGTTDRLRYKRVNERTGQEVNYADIVKGRDIGGALVTLEQSELDEVAPGRSRTIDINAFVSLDEIDPVYFQKTYWLAPNAKEYQRPYALLRHAMQDANQAGIATFVLRGKQYLTALRADDNVLALDTLHFAEEIRDPKELVADVESAAPSENELRMAEQIIDSMSGAWTPEEYEDTYTAKVEQLLAEKAQGATPTTEEGPPQPTDVIDLTEALRRSVDQARGGRGGVPKPRRSQRRSRSSRSEPASPDLSGLNKSELADRARELGIRGRSKMSRADLQDAVASAESGGAKPRTRRAS